VVTLLQHYIYKSVAVELVCPEVNSSLISDWLIIVAMLAAWWCGKF